ncbi:hypothetical protein HHI36_006366, partial [Cryptolaemus montrouzieri]
QSAKSTKVSPKSWCFPIFYKGLRSQLNEDDLYETLKEHESTILGNRLEEAWQEEQEYYKNPSLWRALWKVFGNELLGYGIILFFYEVLLKPHFTIHEEDQKQNKYVRPKL